MNLIKLGQIAGPDGEPVQFDSFTNYTMTQSIFYFPKGMAYGPIAVGAVLLTLSAPSRAQEPKQPVDGVSAPAEAEKAAPVPQTPRPANPLVLPPTQPFDPSTPQNPADNDANDMNGASTPFADYQRGPDTAVKREPVAKELPYFGYTFFDPPRQLIQARRAFLRRPYDQTSTVRALQPKPQNSKPVLKKLRNGSSPAAPGERVSPTDPRAVSTEETNRPDQEADREVGREAEPETPDLSSEYRTLLAGQQPNGSRNDRSVDAAPSPPGKRRNRILAEPGLRAETDAPDENAPNGSRPQDAEEKEADPVNAFSDVADPLSQLQRNVSASIPAGYQLAGGDALILRYGSPTRAATELSRTVDAQGTILLDGVGRLVIRGLTLEQAEKRLRERLGRLYKRVEVSLTLKELRTISITVSGEAFAPGTYVVPAVATAFNVLYAAGGPTIDGSLRQIELRRRGVLVGTMDVYKFILVGSEAGDLSLQPGDLLYIPPRLGRVTLNGEVRRPAVFEMTPDETLRDALRYCGGVKPSGVDQRVQVRTVDPGSARVLRDVDLRDRTQVDRMPLYDGDVVEAFSVRAVLANRVTIEGAVDQPGDYALANGMRIADLLERARGPLGEAFLGRADLYRWNADNTLALIPVDLDKALAGDPSANLPLARWDRLKVYGRSEVAWTGRRDVSVRGAVRRPGVYYRSDNLRVRDLLLLAGGPTPDAVFERAVLLRQRPDGTFRYEYLNLKTGAASLDTALQNNDVLAVYRVGEAQWAPEHLVSIHGEVVAPGVYPRGEGMRVSDVLVLAGGFRPGAGGRVVVAHPRRSADQPETAMSVVEFDARGRCAPQDDLPLEDGDVVTVRGTGGFKNRVEIVTIRGAVNRPGPVVLSSNKMRLSDALREAGGLRPEGYADGVEFYRNPVLLASAGQRSLTRIISSLNDLLNQSSFEREQAKSDLERIKAAGTATQSSTPLPLPGLGQSSDGATTGSVAAVAIAGQLSRRDLVSSPRVLLSEELQPNGNIAVSVADAMRHPGGSDDILLADGDTITIPERPSTVQVVGAVFNARGVLHKPGAGLDHYVANAGGFTPDAARDRIVVIHAGGGLIPSDKARELKPGDVIVVPTRVMAEKLSNRANNLDGVFRSITNSAIVYRLATTLFGL